MYVFAQCFVIFKQLIIESQAARIIRDFFLCQPVIFAEVSEHGRV